MLGDVIVASCRSELPIDDPSGDAFEQIVSLDGGLPRIHGGTPSALSASASGGPAAQATANTANATAPLDWTTMPGLFAGGGVDIMTTVLLRALPPPPKRARLLDFCCGSGIIAAALAAAEPTARLHLIDADALAIRAARLNVPTAKAITLSDCWDDLPPKPRRFNTIVSNPPVHLGLQSDFRVLRTLVAGAAKRLRPAGQL